MYELRNHPSAWEVATLDGDVLGRMELPTSMSPHASFTPGGGLLAVRLEGEAPLEDGDVRVATEDVFLSDPLSFELSGRGGVLWRDGEEFLFVRREGDRLEIRAVSPDGPSRILRTFQGALPGSMAVRGDWIAFSHVENPNTPEAKASSMLARAGNGPARTILTLQGVLESFAWSLDGNRLALGTYPMEPDRPPPSWGLQLLVLEIGSSGQVMGEPSLLDAPEGFWSWSPRWLPDGRGLLVQGEDGNVWQISSQPGVRPVEVTEALPPNNEVWNFHVSPDGRFIAYARGIFRGSSIWRVDLGDALADFQR